MRKYILALSAAFIVSACSSDEAEPEQVHTAYSPDQYSAAIIDIARGRDKESDEARMPGSLLAFAQIDAGDIVGDYVMGGGYVTRLLAIAAGADGKVYAFQPEEFIAFRAQYAEEQDAAVAPYADDEGNPKNVFPLRAPIAAPGWPEQLDTIITVNNYHDLFISQMEEGTAQKATKMLFEALKPGGSLIVVDHKAADGGRRKAADALHRMDAEMALKTLTDAGFVLEAESEIYAQPDDPLNANVFDESIAGNTDQFAWRLRKAE